MTNVTSCPKCDKTLISEEFDTHVCIPQYKPTKYVHVYYTDFFTVRNPDGSQSAVAEDKDGTIYLIDPTNRQLTERNSNREANRTQIDHFNKEVIRRFFY